MLQEDSADAVFKVDYAGAVTAGSAVIPHNPCQTRITQTDTVAVYNLQGNSDATAISFTKVTQLSVDITPAVAGSKILIEVSCQAGDNATISDYDRPACLIGTLFRQKNSGSDTDLSATNATGVVKGLFFSTDNTTRTLGTTPAKNVLIGQHLDSPSYSAGDTLTYSLAVASFDNNGSAAGGLKFQLNNIGPNSFHQAQGVSLIKVTEIPQ